MEYKFLIPIDRFSAAQLAHIENLDSAIKSGQDLPAVWPNTPLKLKVGPFFRESIIVPKIVINVDSGKK